MYELELIPTTARRLRTGKLRNRTNILDVYLLMPPPEYLGIRFIFGIGGINSHGSEETENWETENLRQCFGCTFYVATNTSPCSKTQLKEVKHVSKNGTFVCHTWRITVRFRRNRKMRNIGCKWMTVYWWRKQVNTHPKPWLKFSVSQFSVSLESWELIPPTPTIQMIVVATLHIQNRGSNSQFLSSQSPRSRGN